MPLNEGAVNQILPFAPDGLESSGDLIALGEYADDDMRKRGHQAGLARRGLQNRAQRQAAHVAAGVAQFVANRHAAGVRDDGDLDAVEEGLRDAVREEAEVVRDDSCRGFTSEGQHVAYEGDIAAIARNSMYAVRKGVATGLPDDMPADAWAFCHTMVMPGDAARTQLLWSVDDPDHPGWWRRRAAGAWGDWQGVGGNTDNTAAMRDMQAGAVRLWPSLAIPVLSDGLPLGLPLDGAVVSLATYPRLSRVLCPSGHNAWSPAWYRCTAGGARDVAGGYIKLDDWRGGYPQVLDAGAGRAKSTVLVNTTNGSANVTIVNNLSSGGTLATPYTGSDGIYPGLAISGAGIPAGATVLSVAGTTVTLSAACTATGASVEATVTGRVLGSWQSDAERRVTGTAYALWGSVDVTSTGVLTNPILSSTNNGSLGTGSTAGFKQVTIDTARQIPCAPTARPAGPVASAIILV